VTGAPRGSRGAPEQQVVAASGHVPVLRDEAVAALAVQGDGTWLDGTFGRGGHAREILARLGAGGRLLVMDKDPEAIAVAQALAARDPRVRVRHDSFARMASWEEAGSGLDGVLLDLGVSSPQLDQPERGFSFMAEGPLDMRMDPTRGQGAAAWLAEAAEEEIADVLWRLGEERDSRRIARAVVARRRESPLRTTRELAELVARAVRSREPGKHPATRTFQALRMVVNGELDDLAAGLEAAVAGLRPGGRLAVISFHSLEDRVVKRFIRDASRTAAPGRRGLPPPVDAPAPRLRALGDAVQPSAAEVAANPRSRSAVLRVAERLP
jgi:16S rRNA (cytosine1402-N4)-methyltransferase